jgi:DNA helicase-2/ATP-dependent DNA helicase PcrA
MEGQLMAPRKAAQFRPTQRRVVNFGEGKLGVSAVPGSGKTFTLAHRAARLVAKLAKAGALEEQEVLIVTFTNSAVNAIKARVANILGTQRGLLPNIGYRVRTLHGLAHDIVRERPGLAGLAEDFRIMDERAAAYLVEQAARNAFGEWEERLMNAYLSDAVRDDDRRRNQARQEDMPKLAVNLAQAFVKQAKDRRLTPEVLREALRTAPAADYLLVRYCTDVYDAYRRSLAYQGAVDFDDLVRLALDSLDKDGDYLARLQNKWPYVLEDEAQDSSKLQEELLTRLSAGQNWTRVGDPNQAINTTFTTADPALLRAFLARRDVSDYTMAEAGRSALPILTLANALIDWTVRSHPEEALQDTFLAQQIVATAPDDAQGNPSADEAIVFINYKPGQKITPEEELQQVADSLRRYVQNQPERTVAALVPENDHGIKLAEKLRERSVPYEELLRSTTATRDTAQRLRSVIDFLAEPVSPRSGERLAALYRDLWWPDHLGLLEREAAQYADQYGGDEPLGESTPRTFVATPAVDAPTDGEAVPDYGAWREAVLQTLTALRDTEVFLAPEPGTIFSAPTLPDVAELRADLDAFRERIGIWLRAAVLPIDQLILTVGRDLFRSPPEIALTHKLAGMLRSISLEDENHGKRLPDFAEELYRISSNERRLLGFDDASGGYEPQPGQVTIATMHAAKGLEWDRVYLLAVNNYSFPSAQLYDTYLDEKWFLRDKLNLRAETLAQLNSLTEGTAYYEGEATKQHRIDYAAERLRLLYVGITRARRELLITWNTGRYHASGGRNAEKRPAVPLVALWETLSAQSAGTAARG